MLTKIRWYITVFLIAAIFSGCASMSNRTKTLVAMGVAGIAAGTAGAMAAPADENALAHGFLWGGGASALTGAIGMFIFDEQARSREYERELKVAKDELESIRWGAGMNEERLIYESSAGGDSEKGIPDEVKKLLSPGWIRVYQTSAWVKQGDDSLVHQDKVIRIKKPQLIPDGGPKNETREEGNKK